MGGARLAAASRGGRRAGFFGFGRSLSDQLAAFGPPAGMIGLAAQCVHGLTPIRLLAARRTAQGREISRRRLGSLGPHIPSGRPPHDAVVVEVGDLAVSIADFGQDLVGVFAEPRRNARQDALKKPPPLAVVDLRALLKALYGDTGGRMTVGRWADLDAATKKNSLNYIWSAAAETVVFLPLAPENKDDTVVEAAFERFYEKMGTGR